MSTKQTQLYMYFQNKAHHYQNIQTARPKVVSRLDPSIHHSIQYTSRLKYNRDLPQNKRYEMEVQNGHMTHRIASIQGTSRKEVEVNGNYSRYNSFQRKFRLNNWAQNEQERMRDIKNQKIQAKIASMRPQIGSRKFWEQDYQQKTSLKNKGNSFRGSLHLQQKAFMPQAYLDFLNMINRNESDRNVKDMTHSRSSKGEKQTIAIQKLFVLPNLTSKRPLKLKNSQITLTNSQAELDQKQQQHHQK